MTNRFIKLPIEAMTDARLSHRDLRVLMALYSFGANSGDVVWPSRDSLCQLTRIKPPHVSVSISRLEAFGWVERKQSGHGPNRYTLLCPEVTETVTVTESVTVTETVIRGYQNGNTLTDQEQTIELVTPQTPRAKVSDLFARFWAAYPKKLSKGQAERTFAQLKPNEPLLAEILLGLQRAMTSDQRFATRQYTPNASTWLNAKGWQDEHDQDIPKPATSAAYGQSHGRNPTPPRGEYAKHSRPDNSAVGKVNAAIAARDAARQPLGSGYAGDDFIELGPSDYRAVAH